MPGMNLCPPDEHNGHICIRSVNNFTVNYYYGDGRRVAVALPQDVAMDVDAPQLQANPPPEPPNAGEHPVPGMAVPNRQGHVARAHDLGNNREGSDDDAMNVDGAQDRGSDDAASKLTEAEKVIILNYLPDMLKSRYGPLTDAFARARRQGHTDVRQLGNDDIKEIKKSAWFRGQINRRDAGAAIAGSSAARGPPRVRRAGDRAKDSSSSESDTDSDESEPDDAAATRLTSAEREIVRRYIEDMKNASFKPACRAFSAAHQENPYIRALLTEDLKRIRGLPWFAKRVAYLEKAKSAAKVSAAKLEATRREAARQDAARKEASRAKPAARATHAGQKASKMEPFTSRERKYVEWYLVQHPGRVNITELVRKFRTKSKQLAKDGVPRDVFMQRNPKTIKNWTMREYPHREYYEGE